MIRCTCSHQIFMKAMNHRIPIHTLLLRQFALPLDIEMMTGRIQMVEMEGDFQSKLIKALPPEIFSKGLESAQEKDDYNHHLFEVVEQLSDRQGTKIFSARHKRLNYPCYRDLKPSNIMFKPNGQLTLIDFGTARQYKEHNLEDTTCLGTLGYAAPEQFGGMGQTDPRTDIYCLGVTLYHLVTDENPAEPPYELDPIRTINPQLSYGLEYIIAKCIRRNPEERYQSAAELKKDLDDIKRIDTKRRRKGIVKAIINRIFSKKDNLQEKIPIEEKNTERKQSFETPIIPIVDTDGQTAVLLSVSSDGIVDKTANVPVFKDADKCGVIKKSTLVNLNTVNLCDKVAICISTKNKAIAGEQVNIYFATEAIKSDVVGLITINKGYTMITIGERIVDINLDDNVKIQIDSEDLIFSTNEFEFLWKDYITQNFYQFLSFQINRVLNTEESSLTVHLYVNNKTPWMSRSF